MQKKYLFVGIDASLTSTAISYYFDDTGEWLHKSYMKNFKMSKWPKRVNSCVDFTSYSLLDSDDYATSEASKLLAASSITDQMTLDLRHYEDDYSIYGCIEGYSFASAAGHLIDLVTMGTLIRYKFGLICKAPLYVMSPTQLKKFAAEDTYPKPEKKREPYRNNHGIPGGKFQKHQMMQAILENSSLDGLDFTRACRTHWTEISEAKSIKAPLPDIVDSIWAARAAKSVFSDD